MAAGCAAGDAAVCRTDTDCASGVCLAGGTCALAMDAGGEDGAPGTDGAPASDGDVVTCAPDHDYVITRDEVLLAAGQQATFRIAQDVTVSTAGTLSPQGEQSWDLAASLAGDHDVEVHLEPMTGHWFAPSFPGASYAVRLSSTNDLLGVFELTDDALLLRGVVSPEGGPTRTELAYDPPVTVLELPLTSTSAWSVDTTATGVTGGVWAVATESYDIAVDAGGIVATPYGPFPVLRVATDLTRTAGGVVVTSKSYAFVAECYGIVATIASHEYETDDDFSEASEVRRLAP